MLGVKGKELPIKKPWCVRQLVMNGWSKSSHSFAAMGTINMNQQKVVRPIRLGFIPHNLSQSFSKVGFPSRHTITLPTYLMPTMHVWQRTCPEQSGQGMRAWTQGSSRWGRWSQSKWHLGWQQRHHAE
jgi:hypothetical protein